MLFDCLSASETALKLPTGNFMKRGLELAKINPLKAGAVSDRASDLKPHFHRSGDCGGCFSAVNSL